MLNPAGIDDLFAEMVAGKTNSFVDGDPYVPSFIYKMIVANMSKISQWLSVQMLLMATIDRAFSLYEPFTHQTIFTKRNVLAAIIGNWIFLISYAVLYNVLAFKSGMKVWYMFQPDNQTYSLTLQEKEDQPKPKIILTGCFF